VIVIGRCRAVAGRCVGVCSRMGMPRSSVVIVVFSLFLVFSVGEFGSWSDVK